MRIKKKLVPGIDYTTRFTEAMLVERGVRDRYSLAFMSSPNAFAGTEKLDILVAAMPQRVRVRSLRLTVDSQSAAGCNVWGILAVLPENITANSIVLPTAANPVWDFWEPASGILWTMVGDTDFNNNLTIFDRDWEGDGRVIDLKVGDRIIWMATTGATGGDAIIWGIIDIEILS